jgi:hypothetical protein
MDNILIQAVAAAMFAKVLVDMVKLTPAQTLGWVLVLLAFAFGQASSFLLFFATVDGAQLTTHTVSNCALVGILAAGSAIGVTELQKRAEANKAGF